jgi:hypothetical protein
MTRRIALLVIGTLLAAALVLPGSAFAGGGAHRGGHSYRHFQGQHHVRGHGDFRHGHGHFRSFRHHHFGHFAPHPGLRFGVHGAWRWTGWSWVWSRAIGANGNVRREAFATDRELLRTAAAPPDYRRAAWQPSRRASSTVA